MKGYGRRISTVAGITGAEVLGFARMLSIENDDIFEFFSFSYI